MKEIEIIGKPKQNSEKEVLNYIGCLDLITEKLLKSLEDVHTENEQYFGECSILGTDRLSLKESVKDLLEINMKALIRRVETNQEIKVVFGDKELFGCPSCDYSSNNKEDFSHVKGDTFHYCKKCIKKHNLIKQDAKGDKDE